MKQRVCIAIATSAAAAGHHRRRADQRARRGDAAPGDGDDRTRAGRINAAVILIGHDMGLMAQFVGPGGVMYAGAGRSRSARGADASPTLAPLHGRCSSRRARCSAAAPAVMPPAARACGPPRLACGGVAMSLRKRPAALASAFTAQPAVLRARRTAARASSPSPARAAAARPRSPCCCSASSAPTTGADHLPRQEHRARCSGKRTDGLSAAKCRRCSRTRSRCSTRSTPSTTC